MIHLTRRQAQVLSLAAQGLTAAHSALALDVKEYTVRKLRTQVLQRLNALNITHAVALTAERGLLGPDDDRDIRVGDVVMIALNDRTTGFGCREALVLSHRDNGDFHCEDEYGAVKTVRPWNLVFMSRTAGTGPAMPATPTQAQEQQAA